MSIRKKAQITWKSTDAKNRRTQEATKHNHLAIGVPAFSSSLLPLFRFVAYRISRPVSEFNLYCDAFGRESAYYFCPRCDVTLERDYQAYCDRCGQQLDWKRIDKARRRFSDG